MAFFITVPFVSPSGAEVSIGVRKTMMTTYRRQIPIHHSSDWSLCHLTGRSAIWRSHCRATTGLSRVRDLGGAVPPRGRGRRACALERIPNRAISAIAGSWAPTKQSWLRRSLPIGDPQRLGASGLLRVSRESGDICFSSIGRGPAKRRRTPLHRATNFTHVPVEADTAATCIWMGVVCGAAQAGRPRKSLFSAQTAARGADC